MTTITIRVDHEGAKPKHDLAVQEKLTLEAVRQSRFDLVCYTTHKLVSMINRALEEKEDARHSGANP